MEIETFEHTKLGARHTVKAALISCEDLEEIFNFRAWLCYSENLFKCSVSLVTNHKGDFVVFAATVNTEI